MIFRKIFLVLTSVLLLSVNGFGDDIVLDFEGLQNREQVKDFYNGGRGSDGSTYMHNYHITFSSNTLALIDGDNGGSGNFANEPSPNTIFFFTGDATSVYMNVEEGFSGGFSFYYTSVEDEGDVEVWTEPNGRGKMIGSLHLEVTPHLGKGDPTGLYDNWVKKSLSFDGKAKSIVFKGVSNHIGFDNIALNPNSEQTIMKGVTISPIGESTDTEALSHGKCDKSNEFLVQLKFKTDNELGDVCGDYYFEFIGDVGGATLSDCGGKVKRCNLVKEDNKDEYKLSLNFKINKIGNGYYFKNGKLKVLKKSNGKSASVEIWKNFDAYGTEFDIKKDAFRFANSSWNKAVTKRDVNNQVTFKNDIAKAGDVVQEYLRQQKKENRYDPDGQEEFWNSVGYDKSFEREYWLSRHDKHTSLGLCYGMALVSASNFIHKDEPSWGMGTLETWKSEIDEHWDETKGETKVSNPKPFDIDKIYDYDANNIQALKKIMYYFVGQGSYYHNAQGIPYKEFNNPYWVGKEADTNTYPVSLIEKNQPIPMGIYFQGGGGHEFLNTEYFSYTQDHKKHAIHVIYDNNQPNSYSYQKSTDGEIVTKKYDRYIINDYDFTDPNGDILHIYSSNSKQSKITPSKKDYAKDAQQMPELDYTANEHIKVYMLGGTFKNVVFKDNGKNVLLYPLNEEPKKGKAYKIEDNIFKNILLLPSDKKYEITVQKQSDFVTTKFFVTIPQGDGTAEYIVYDHAEVSEKDPTVMHLTVGINNNDTSIKREGASDYQPDSKEVYKLKLNSVSSINAIVSVGGVNLSWQNPSHPNYAQSVVIRKIGSVPSSINDGVEVYRGTDEEFLDTNVANNTKYYYAVYAISKDDQATTPVWTMVDTYRYTLYGTLSDENSEPIQGAIVTLYNNTKTKVIDTATSATNGLFSFNNLLDGDYVLSFNHPYYRFENSELNVTLDSGSKEVTVLASGLPSIVMDIPQILKTNEEQNIIWGGLHIDDNAKVTIKVKKDDQWKTVASDISYNQHSYKWKPMDINGTTTVRVEYDSKVYDEKDVMILGKAVNSTGATTSSSGGGGGAMGYLFPLFALVMLFWRREE